jgi:hypothetical protein
MDSNAEDRVRQQVSMATMMNSENIEEAGNFLAN